MITGPAFRTGEIRRSMDVFSLDGEKIGTVIRVLAGPEPPSSEEASVPGKPQEREFDGEAIGPAPTRAAGNFGPATQSPEHGYGVKATGGESLGDGAMLIGTVYGMFFRKWIPLREVQTVSMERIVLRRLASEYE
jgi:hypothetical protein